MRLSELKEEQWEIFNFVPVGALVLGSDYTVKFWNHCLENWSGVPSAKIKGKFIADQFPHWTSAGYMERLHEILASRVPTVFSWESSVQPIPCFLADGSPRILQTTATPLSCPTGGEPQGLFVLQDVTCFAKRIEEYRIARDEALKQFEEHKQIEIELRRAKQHAERADHIKGSFLATSLSHEIRTPMTLILGYTELLKQEWADCEKSLGDLEKIERSTKHLLQLINDILDLSKIEAGQLEVERIPCAPTAIAQEIVSIMAVKAETKGISLELKNEAGIPDSVNTDPMRVQQVLINLIGNAIKFTDAGIVLVSLRAVERKQGGSEIQFRVEDTGPGVPEDKIDNIFTPFVQVNRDSGKNYEGTGLGLSICKHLADLLKGSLSVESKTNIGSTFTFSIPCDLPSEVRVIQTQSRAVEPGQRNVNPRGGRRGPNPGRGRQTGSQGLSPYLPGENRRHRRDGG